MTNLWDVIERTKDLPVSDRVALLRELLKTTPCMVVLGMSDPVPPVVVMVRPGDHVALAQLLDAISECVQAWQ